MQINKKKSSLLPVFVLATLAILFTAGISVLVLFLAPKSENSESNSDEIQMYAKFQRGFDSENDLRRLLGDTHSLFPLPQTTFQTEPSPFPNLPVTWQYQSDYCDKCNCTDFDPPVFIMDDAFLKQASSNEMNIEYSKTNNQVVDIEEADVVKTDGSFLYVIPRNEPSVVIAKTLPFHAPEVVSTIDLSAENVLPSDLLLRNDFLVVLGSTTLPENSASEYEFTSFVTIQLWDVSNRTAPRLRQTQQIEGFLIASRSIEDIAYVVIQTW